jgi:hypothetical protein
MFYRRESVQFYVQNALKLTYRHLYKLKNFPGLYPRTPFKGEGRKGRTEMGKEGIRDTDGEEGSGTG